MSNFTGEELSSAGRVSPCEPDDSRKESRRQPRPSETRSSFIQGSEVAGQPAVASDPFFARIGIVIEADARHELFDARSAT